MKYFPPTIAVPAMLVMPIVVPALGRPPSVVVPPTAPRGAAAGLDGARDHGR